MDFQNCWNSVSCLEGVERFLRLIPGIAAIFILGGVTASYLVSKQVTFLKTPRVLTEAQIAILFGALKDKPTAEFRVTSWADSEESAQFGGQLSKILKNIGWDSKGMTRYYMDEGDAPPSGVNIMVDGLHPESMKSAQNVFEAFQASGIHEVHLSTNPSEAIPSSWVLIQVGRKPNL